MDSGDLLTLEQGRSLLQLARYALDRSINPDKDIPYPPPTDPRLEEQGATFVTLTLAGVLRGCIGTPQARCSLVEDVQENAVRAATMDPVDALRTE